MSPQLHPMVKENKDIKEHVSWIDKVLSTNEKELVECTTNELIASKKICLDNSKGFKATLALIIRALCVKKAEFNMLLEDK